MKEIKNIGYIYKITNLVNKKVYIGQTKQTLKERWKKHIVDSKISNYALHKAMRKYGIDNFKFEEVEMCEIDNLDAREIYWISFYNSFNKKKGYNLTLGGGGNKLLNLNEEEIVKSYEEFRTLKKVSEKFNCSSHVIRNILKKHNIKIKTEKEHAKEKGNKVYRCDLNGNILEEYICLNEAGKWLLDNGLTKARDARNAGMAIKKNIIKDKSYKGFIWKCTLYENIDSTKYFENQIKNKKYKNSINKSCKSKGKKCLICQKIISNTATYCNDCNNQIRKQNAIKQREEILGLSRETLKQKIRTTSFLQIGKEYGVTDNAIRKWCKKYNLPFKSNEIKKYSDEEWENI